MYECYIVNIPSYQQAHALPARRRRAERVEPDRASRHWAQAELTQPYNGYMDSRSDRHIRDILKERNIEIIGADPITRHGFTQVPNFILTNKDISVGAKLACATYRKWLC
jgi:hypothetical protein